MTNGTDILSTLATQFLPQMTPAERRSAIESLQSIIDAERFKLAVRDASDDAIVCPECEGTHIVKRGKDSAGRQRYLCRECSMSFTLVKKNVFSRSKLDEATWMKYIECFVDVLPLRECARRCNVSLKTAWFMRHRIIEALHSHIPSFEVRKGCGVELDETFFRENFKGNHTRSSFELPRPARHHGNENHKRGISNEQICVLTGINDAGDMFYEIAGRGRLNSGAAFSLLEDKIEEGAIVSTDKLNSYAPVMRELGVACHNAYDAKEHGKLNRINNLHSRIDFFMVSFRGVSTRRLGGYLAWFKWLYSFKRQRSASDMAELIVRQLSDTMYTTSWRRCKDTPHLFMEYWGKAA